MNSLENADVYDLLNRLKKLNTVGVALSSEKNSHRLLERILEAAKTLTYADGGTLYTYDRDQDLLKFEIMMTDTLGIHKGGTSGENISLPPIALHDAQGLPNMHMVAACAAITKSTINIPDAYQEDRFEFSGMRKFDEAMNYRSVSFLTVPMTDHQNEIIGVLQLLNATEPNSGHIHPFTGWEQELVESLASQAAMALVNQRFVEEQKILFEAFIKLIARAIDDKSPYTGGHCSRVPVLTMMLAEAAVRANYGSEEIRHFDMNEDDRYELWVAGMLHDCGKITTKEYVVDKGTKLETIFDRIHLVDLRFETLKRDAEIDLLKQQVAALKNHQDFNEKDQREAFNDYCKTLDEEREFIRKANIGGEFMSEEDRQTVCRIAQRRWRSADGQEHPLLFEDELCESLFYPCKPHEVRDTEDLRKFKGEVENLCIPKGTLRDKERKHINYHINATINMLETLPYPKHLARVPEFAGGHHERMDGKGYPKGLKREEMSVQARAMGIADVFEALTAGDRPYKRAMPLSTALTILGRMKQDHHIDPELFNVFIHEKVYEEYARQYLQEEQMDEVDITQLPGYEAR